eukprot:7006694-Alexandrium_andersonii.AAC.1
MRCDRCEPARETPQSTPTLHRADWPSECTADPFAPPRKQSCQAESGAFQRAARRGVVCSRHA